MPDFSTLIPKIFNSLAAEISVSLAALVAAWRLKLWKKLKACMARRKANRTAIEQFAQSWPDVSKSIADGARITQQFQTLSADLNKRLDSQDNALHAIRAMQWGHLKLDPQARFICDNTGRNINVNPAFAKLLRVGEHNLLGFGYKNQIAQEAVREYVQKWEQASKEHRPFEDTVIFVRGDYTKFLGHVRLVPYPEDADDGPASHWFGLVTLVKEL